MKNRSAHTRKTRLLSLLLAALLPAALAACSAKAGAVIPAGQTAAASAPSLAPDPGTSSSGESGGVSQAPASSAAPAAGFERPRLWDATLDAVVAGFTAAQAETVLAGPENALFSPVGVYLTLGIITDGAEGTTHAQLMDALGATSPGDAIPYREVDDFFWNALQYSGVTDDDPAFWGQDGEAADEAWAPALSVANSLWLGEGRTFRESFVSNTNYYWYAEEFADIPFGTPAADEAFNNWVTEATGGRIQSAYATSGETAMLAASAAFLRDGWLDAFQPANTAQGEFTRADGTASQASYMTQTLTNHGVYQADSYTQTVMLLNGGAEMHFILPNEGVTTSQLLADPAALNDMLRHQYGKYADLTLSLPQFSFTSTPPVKEGVQSLGVTDAFDPSLADFSAMLDKTAAADGLYLSDLAHQAFIAVDENGVEAAAVTVADVAATAAVAEESAALEIRLDRPFLFFIRYQGMPLFMGVVNDPAA